VDSDCELIYFLFVCLISKLYRAIIKCIIGLDCTDIMIFF